MGTMLKSEIVVVKSPIYCIVMVSRANGSHPEKPMNPFALLCFVLDVLLLATEEHPDKVPQDERIVVATSVTLGVPQREVLSCLLGMKDEKLIRVDSTGGVILTQKGMVSARRARFLAALAAQNPLLN